MRAIIKVIVFSVTTCSVFAETEEEKFGSIDAMNLMLGKKLLGLKDAYGTEGEQIGKMTKSFAYLLGEMREGQQNDVFGIFATVGDPLEVNRTQAGILLNTKHIALWPLGTFVGKFALVFSDAANKQIVIIACKSESRFENGEFIWYAMEAKSMNTVGLDEPASQFLSNIFDSLKKRIDIKVEK